jgi:hypothetical protein
VDSSSNDGGDPVDAEAAEASRLDAFGAWLEKENEPLSPQLQQQSPAAAAAARQ